MTGRTRHHARFFLTLGMVLLAVVLASPALAAPPSTLTGESLTGTPTITNPGTACTRSTTADGASHTFSYAVSGVATGPYPGAFTENGTVTFVNDHPDIQGDPAGTVTSWNVSFRINSAAGQVAGAKRLSRSPGAIAVCGDVTGPGFSLFDRGADGTLDYGALIRIGSHTYLDYGTSHAHEVSFDSSSNGVPFTFFDFSETFASALQQPLRIR